MLQVLARRMRPGNERISDFVFMDVPAPGKNTYRAPFTEPTKNLVPTHQNLQLVGTSRETVNKALWILRTAAGSYATGGLSSSTAREADAFSGTDFRHGTADPAMDRVNGLHRLALVDAILRIEVCQLKTKRFKRITTLILATSFSASQAESCFQFLLPV